MRPQSHGVVSWLRPLRYLSEGSMAKLYTTGDNYLVAALDSGA